MTAIKLKFMLFEAIFTLTLFTHCLVQCTILYQGNTFHGHSSSEGFTATATGTGSPATGPRVISLDSEGTLRNVLYRTRREAAKGTPSTKRPLINVYHLQDKDHNEAIIHWSGKNSPAIFLLTRQRDGSDTVLDSRLYRSIDYGHSYQDITQNLQKESPGKAVPREFFVSPTNPNILLFTDHKNKKIYATDDEGKTFKVEARPDVPNVILFHPTREKWVLLYSDETDTLYMDSDLGRNGWNLVQRYVNPRFSWAVPHVDKNDTYIHMEIQDPFNKGMYYFKTCGIPYCKDVTHDKTIGSIDVSSMLVINEYIFVQKTNNDRSALYVSYLMENGIRSSFQLALFPNDAKIKDCVVLDSDQHEVFLAVKDLDTQNVDMYISDSTGKFYVKTQGNIKHTPLRYGFFMDFAEIHGIPGRYVTNHYTQGHSYETIMTFDQGRTWLPLAANQTGLNGTTICTPSTCRLTLLLGRYILSEANAPGLIFAQGFVQTTIRTHAVFMSSDAGITWIQLNEGIHKTIIMDQGGAMVMVPPTRVSATSSLIYSSDEGKTWQVMRFTGKPMFVDGIVTEPGINTLILTMFGHTQNKSDGWFVQTLNFTNILSRKCIKNDYVTWQLKKKKVPTATLR